MAFTKSRVRSPSAPPAQTTTWRDDESASGPICRVDLGGHPPRSPTDPDVPVEASGSSGHGFAARGTSPYRTTGLGSGYRFNRRLKRSHVMQALSERRSNPLLPNPH